MSQEHGAATQGVGAGPDVLRINAEPQGKATGESLGGWAERRQGLKPGKMAPQSLKQSSPEMTPIPSSGYFLHVVSAVATPKCRLLFLVLLGLKHLIFSIYTCVHTCVASGAGGKVVMDRAMWALGAKLRSSARAVSALHHRAISPAPLQFFLLWKIHILPPY